jgi:hypothetical protein
MGQAMTGIAQANGGRRRGGWRIAIWGMAASLLLLPLAAMQLTDDVKWSGSDFIVWGAMLFAACGTYELAARMTADIFYRAAAGVAVLAAFLLVWINLAVGIIGTEQDPANLMFAGVLAVAIAGAAIARFRPQGMARAFVAAAVAQAMVGLIAMIGGLGSDGPIWPREVLALTGFFTFLWLLSALLFRKVAREQGRAGVGLPG